MKKELRRKLMQLIYSLGLREVYGNGEDVSSEVNQAFEMLFILTDEETINQLTSMWEKRNDGLNNIVWAPSGNELNEALLFRLMKFEKEATTVLTERKYI